ncbi:hypothetical protein FHS43_002523 [Streptosporangium becharense]|uniref:Uncharacterized protein n=1 Tax=Streptosporangium becharense TaxID=1816182 RepID=A0A7W9MIQ1_9ACTN|nr:hypothetical protein [Streptosporangium becharense]MBB2911258.1 hypothetical protein [Streptosporangium becharense]MBB5821684.1 hypothetical protein [Streptosporangium becharense]
MKTRDLEGWDGRLVELAWELSALGFDSVVRFPSDEPPSVQIFLSPGRPRATTAQRGRTSVFTWPRYCAQPNRDQWGRTKMRVAAERILEAAR